MAAVANVTSGGPHPYAIGYPSSLLSRFHPSVRHTIPGSPTSLRTQLICRWSHVAQPLFLAPKSGAGPRARGVQATGVQDSSRLGLTYERDFTLEPTPRDLLSLYKSNKIQKMWLGCESPKEAIPILKAITSDKEAAKMKVYLYINYSEVPKIAQDPAPWVDVINDYASHISHVCLSEVSLMMKAKYEPDLVENAMKNIQNNVPDTVKVSTSVSTDLFRNGYTALTLPSTCRFTQDAANMLRGPLKLMGQRSSPLFLKLAPYFEVTDGIDMSHFLIDPEVKDPYLHDGDFGYKYVLDAMVDSIHCALDDLDFPNVGVSVESGWPTEGSKKVATLENARKYNNNLLLHVDEETPRKKKPIDYFIFSILDEEEYPHNPADLKHFGAFTARISWKNKTFP